MAQAYLTVICDLNTNDRDAMKSYLSRALPLFDAAGGKTLLRLKRVEMLKGSMASLVSLLVFPSADAIRGVFDSEAYKKLIEARDRGFTDLSVAITEEFDSAALL